MSDFSRVLAGKGKYVLEVIPNDNDIHIHEGYSVLHGMIGISTEDPLVTIPLDQPENIIQWAKYLGIDLPMIAQWIDEEYLESLHASGDFEKAREIVNSMSDQTREMRIEQLKNRA